jgi:GT2 family glycosyltransferase
MLYFILVNYNNSQYSINCIESILKNRGDNSLKIFIVDNNSSIEEKSKLSSWNDSEKYKEFVQLIFLEKNIGYFPAINTAYIDILDCLNEKDMVVIGNNDLEFDELFIDVLQKKKYPEDVFVISPDIINNDNNHQNPAIRKKYSKLQILYLELYHLHYFIAVLINLFSSVIKFRGSQKSKKGCQESGYVSIGYGACYVLTHRYFQNIKEIPHYLFLMNEENALSNIVFKHNGRIFYDTDLVVFHKEHSSVSKLQSKNKYKIGQESYKISKKHFKNSTLYDKKIK